MKRLLFSILLLSLVSCKKKEVFLVQWVAQPMWKVDYIRMTKEKDPDYPRREMFFIADQKEFASLDKALDFVYDLRRKPENQKIKIWCRYEN